MIGSVLSHYKVLSKLGEGGMGAVYLAEDSKLDRRVALKVLPEAMASDPDRLARFEREAKAIAALNHPNIITVYSIEQHGDVRFITMELVEGKPLDLLIPSGGFDLSTFFEFAIPLADALAVAHGRGITHRDLKPSNVMVTDEDRLLKVLDFGLAKFETPSAESEEATPTLVMGADLTQEGAIMGTMPYMSPEQVEGKSLDQRTDIFSFGIILYEMLTGGRPFRGETSASLTSAILRDPPRPLTESRVGLPRHLGRIVDHCLEKESKARFQSAREVHNQLVGLRKEIESGVHSELAPFAAAAPSSARSQRQKRIWSGVAAVAAVLAVAAFAVSRRSSPPEPERVLTSRPLVSLLGMEEGGSWSPDGSFVAYAHSASGPMDISVIAAVGGDPISLVESEADDVRPRWSPDNRWIAFESSRGDESVPTPASRGRSVYLVPPLGGSVRRLSDGGSLGATPWSKDGGSLLVSRSTENGSTAVWKIEVDSGREELMTRPEPGQVDFGASWSFKGDRIAFGRSDGPACSLMVLSATTGNARQALSEPDACSAPSWSPDDRQLIYSKSAGELWSVDLTTSRLRQLTSGSDNQNAPIVSRSGQILFSTFSHQTDVYIRDLRQAEARRLTAHTFDNTAARFSPDGETVVYSSSRTGNLEIWSVELETAKERQLTNRQGADGAPDWSPDGTKIAYLSIRDGKSELWVMDAFGGGQRKVCDSEVGWPIRFTPDGAGIGYLTSIGEGQALFVADLATGETREYLRGVADYDWYRDDRHVVYRPEDPASASEIRVVDLETGSESVMLDEPNIEINVRKDGSGLSYCSATSHRNMNLFVLPLEAPTLPSELPRAAGPPEQITQGDGVWHTHNGGWSLDGNSVVFTRDTDAGDVYVLDGAFP